MLPVSLACPFFVAPSVHVSEGATKNNTHKFHRTNPTSFSLRLKGPVSCVSNVARETGLDTSSTGQINVREN